ncbi:MAG: ECF transporter S component [Clostridia bacterium]|nr:ECF transporter S component [Clostridia bacterium]
MSKKLKRILFSELMEDLSKTQKIAYISVMTALLVICNMFFEFKFADTQYSLTILFSVIAGIIIGPIFGFSACFLGDLVGFLYNSGGYPYYPWIGLAMGIVALISGFIMNGVNLKFKGQAYVKILIVCILTFVICTVGINTTAFWFLYNGCKTPYFIYLGTRLFVSGQIWNSLLNYALVFILYPIIVKLTKVLVKNK